MIILNVVKNLKKDFPWEEFISTMLSQGFQVFHSLTVVNRSQLSSGKIMLVGNHIGSGPIRDPSFLSLEPYIIFRPVNEDQLKKIVIESQNFKIPITFASGKTGLSGGFANFGILVDLENMHTDLEPILLDIPHNKVYAEQSVLISDLIKIVNFKSK
ncbi:MAG: hypothetical protein P8Y23_09000, partial [Candidatus Lokiarchaeota archaeon]